MPVPRWLDRLWLTLIALSFLILVPGFLWMWAERAGWLSVVLFVVAMFLIGFYRGLPGHSRDV